jgi:hypothetical protein
MGGRDEPVAREGCGASTFLRRPLPLLLGGGAVYVGTDMSSEASSVCVVDANGKIVPEGKIPGEPDALIPWLGGLN